METKTISKEQRIRILQQPLHQQFILHYSNTNGGFVLIHKLVDTNDSDYELLVAIGIILANGYLYKIKNPKVATFGTGHAAA